jgi:hypothetical protein
MDAAVKGRLGCGVLALTGEVLGSGGRRDGVDCCRSL